MKVKEGFYCVEQKKSFVAGDDYQANKARISHLQGIGKLEKPRTRKVKSEDKNGKPNTEKKTE